MTVDDRTDVTIADLRRCFSGAVPAVLTTASLDGVPNVTYLSRVQQVDDERIALSNQFFSKTARNLAENPRAQMLLIDPVSHDEYRLDIVYERTERRGPVFERLRADVDAIAALTGMQDVFKLRAADIYRIVDLRQVEPSRPRLPEVPSGIVATTGGLAELSVRLSRCADLDTLVGATVDGLANVLGYQHCMFMLLDEDGRRLYTIASRGYDHQGVGSEVVIGDGVVGMAALHCAPMRVGNLRQMRKYSRNVRQAYEEHGAIAPGTEIPVPGLDDAESRLAVPALALGQLVGVLVVEDRRRVAFDESDEAALSVVATLVANAVETIRAEERGSAPAATASPSSAAPTPARGAATHVRHFAVDGSTFVDGDYLIKGVAGRILWSLLRQYTDEGRTEFSNREVRRDPSLEMPEYRDNLESRLILLKRRLDERDAPIRIEKTGRGRFRLDVDTSLRLDLVGA